ncbi:NRDE family protein [Catenovulum sp. SX2]|uniref:NRDE family protein n=1 Tax=Catenovulum sp. SX2 TaxID=3398614 RepID=UPI003F844BC5
MCTLTWQMLEGGYRLLFTRDEQRSRAPALLPQVDEKLAAVYPLDPQGQGTWIATNKQGQTWCLLNLYAEPNAEPTNIRPIQAKNSRGEIILMCLEQLTHSTLSDEQIKDWLQLLCESKGFTPFTLCYFPEVTEQQDYQPKYWQWDGQQITQGSLPKMFTSSGKLFSEVKNNRQAVFAHMPKVNQQDAQWAFHQSHVPLKSHLSVCMHREDAKSISLTEVIVKNNLQQMSYWQSSPCKADYQQPDRLIRL